MIRYAQNQSPTASVGQVGGPTPVGPDKEIVRELRGLSESVSLLENTVAELEKALNPVLTPPVPANTGDCGGRRLNESPLGGQIAEISALVSTITGRICDVRQRLAL